MFKLRPLKDVVGSRLGHKDSLGGLGDVHKELAEQARLCRTSANDTFVETSGPGALVGVRTVQVVCKVHVGVKLRMGKEPVTLDSPGG